MTTKKHSSSPHSLTLHHLLVDLSFWGTSVRVLLFAVLAAVAFAFSVSEATTEAGVDRQIMLLIYALGSFLLLDFGYTLVARAYPLRRWFDVLVLLVLDGLLAMLYIVPKVVVARIAVGVVDPLVYVFFLAVGAVGARLLVGLLCSTKAPKKR